MDSPSPNKRMIRQAFHERGKNLQHLQAERLTSEAEIRELRQRLAIQERLLQKRRYNELEDILLAKY